MKKLFFLAISVFVFATSCKTEEKDKYVIGFYNVENLFDVSDDPHKDDAQFLPDGQNKWTQDKYEMKLHNIAYAISSMAQDNGQFHSVLGVAEVENFHVLDDLLAQPELKKANYRYIHYEGPDTRGIDVALLYDPKVLKVIDSKSIPYDFNTKSIVFEKTEREQAEFRTRDVLMVRGTIEDEMFAFFVAHLPSRQGDKGMDLRSRGAEIIYENALSLMEEFPGIKIVVMGDMNDDPVDESMTEYLHAVENISDVEKDDFFSPFISMLKAGYGSLEYRGTWEIFDQILVNDALTEGEGLKIRRIEADRFFAKVYKKDFLIQQEGRYKGTPFRTFSSGDFANGYSDHLPTFIEISK